MELLVNGSTANAQTANTKNFTATIMDCTIVHYIRKFLKIKKRFAQRVISTGQSEWISRTCPLRQERTWDLSHSPHGPFNTMKYEKFY